MIHVVKRFSLVQFNSVLNHADDIHFNNVILHGGVGLQNLLELGNFKKKSGINLE